MLAAVAIVALAVVAAAGAILLTGRGELAAGTRIGGIDVGGLTPAGARARVLARTRDVIARPVALRTDARDVSTSGAELEAKPRFAKALAVAKQVGMWGKLRARLGLGGAQDVRLEYDLARRPLARLVAGLDRSLGTPARDAEVEKRPGALVLRPAAAGLGIDEAALVERLDDLPEEVDVPLRRTRPEITTHEAAVAIQRAKSLLSRRRYVGVGTTVVAFSPAVLRKMLEFAPADGRLEVRLDREILDRRLRPIERLGDPARDAHWRTEGQVATLVPARDGHMLDVAAIEASLTHDLDSTVHRVKFDTVAPKLTTAKARSYRITELISEFTTHHPCCAPRVTNIHRAAEILDGTVVPAGGTFSLNEALGKRTIERGFVQAPQIFSGRLEDAIGGGVSQISTTLYNAAFFGGMRIDEHQPHQFYISRYPMGREATVSWGGPEMIWTNDWPAAVLIRVTFTDTSVTVRLYSTRLGRRVETETLAPCCYVQPRTFASVNRTLDPGETRIVQPAGPAGFTVKYTRKVFVGARVKRDERYTWRYDAENAYVEKGPPKGKGKKGKGKNPPQPGAVADATPAAAPDPPSGN